jgi:pyruvate kinase
MIDHLRRATHELQRGCRIAMDIAGPKLRTTALLPGPAVVKIKPRRDAFGHVATPAVVVLTTTSRRSPVRGSADAILELDGGVPPHLTPGDRITFTDARGKARDLRVRTSENDMVVGELERTAYIVSETPLRFATPDGPINRIVMNVPTVSESILLKDGDTLVLTPESEPGHPALRDAQDRVVVPASIGITLPEVFRDVVTGDAIWLDDGKIGGVVRTVSPGQIAVEITHARPSGSRLSGEKGVNLPDTHLHVSALTKKDQDDLTFIAQHADLIGYSFVRHADDIQRLRHCLAELNAEHLGLLLKVETRHAFHELPKLLLASMQGGPFGVMIARGDLAVECGYERMAEVQEEILWICEAAHTPVIWATQVLESLAKTGIPSRAEVTDAAMSERAECVMLNKGPHVCDAVRSLDDILRRMQAHQTKKRAMLRPLHVAHDVLSELADITNGQAAQEWPR